jgi:hypothetical protein
MKGFTVRPRPPQSQRRARAVIEKDTMGPGSGPRIEGVRSRARSSA